MNKYILAAALALTILCRAAYSQTPVGQNVIFPSPNVATLQRFVDYPVNYSTGLAQISLPLYDIQLRNFHFPVSIDDHASGTVAGCNFSPLGIGWALTATGFISREIHGRPDEKFPALEMSAEHLDSLYSSTTEKSYPRLLLNDISIPEGSHDPYSSLYGGNNNSEDPEHDIFTFSVNGLYGKFTIDNIGNAKLLSPYSGISISGEIGTSPNSGGFRLTDAKGNLYIFGHAGGITYGAIETAKITRYTSGGSTTNDEVNSSWFLAQIVTHSGDTINFSYGSRYTDDSNIHINDNISGSQSSSTIVTYGYGESTAGANPAGPEMTNYFYGGANLGSKGGPFSTTVNGGTNYLMSYLTGISFSHGNIVFSYDDNTLSLNSCTINDLSGAQVKKVTFNYALTGPSPAVNNTNEILTNLHTQGAAGAPLETHTFTYYPDGGGGTGKDWWGYFNGGTIAVPPSDPTRSDPYYDDCHDCRVGNGSAAGMLRTITYPTGGTTTFTYEPNKYQDIVSHAYENGPGLRIDSIVNDDGSGVNRVTKSYKYGNNENGIGVLLHQPDYRDFYTDQQHICIDNDNYYGYYFLRTYTTDPVDGMAEAYRQPMYYGTVTEYTKSSNGNINGKIVYTYSIPESSGGGPTIPRTFKIRAWTGSKLTGKTVYKYQQGSYIPVSSSTTNYATFHYSAIPQIKLFRTAVVKFEDGDQSRALEETMVQGLYTGTTGGNFYSYVDNPIESGVELPTFENHSTFNSQGTIASSTGTTYEYHGQNHVQPTKSITTTSRGDTLVTENIYPLDFGPGANSVMNPLESRTYRVDQGGGNKRLTASTYTVWHGLDQPDSIFNMESATPITNFDTLRYDTGLGSLVKDTRYVKKQLFNYDNDQNLVEQYAFHNAHTSYLWSYGGEYPVAKIENADYTSVQSVLGSTNIATYRDANPTDGDLNTFLAPLRTDSRLSAAQITTYAYKPLIGVTSMTDPKGETTYYTYDDSHRLQGVWDHNKSLVKSYCYNYQNQLTGCPVLYPPGQLFVRFEPGSTSSNTSSDGSGGTITTTTENMTVRFYADQACTQPITLSQAITVELDDYYYIYNALANTGSTGSEVYGTYYVSPGYSNYNIGSITTHVSHDYYDSYGNSLEDTQDYSYYSNFVAGSVYVLE